jgi:putative endonuclease
MFSVYALTNKRNDALYIGVTSNLKLRIYEHKQKMVAGFSQRYGLDKLVYYEVHETAQSAITREKQMKE